MVARIHHASLLLVVVGKILAQMKVFQHPPTLSMPTRALGYAVVILGCQGRKRFGAVRGVLHKHLWQHERLWCGLFSTRLSNCWFPLSLVHGGRASARDSFLATTAS